MVVDSSVIIATFFREAHSEWARDRLEEFDGELIMSTVNLMEVLLVSRDRLTKRADEIEERLLTSGIRWVPPDVRQASLAATARLRYPLNIGDCFAYALAVAERTSILTVDRDFRSLDVPVVLP